MVGYRISYTETMTDKHGVERLYGYTSDGLKIWLNMIEVKREYEKMGIRDLETVV